MHRGPQPLHLPDADPDGADVGNVHPTLDEFRYHSGDETCPAPLVRLTA